jgi:CheY-like chemotaxis protein/anti-sigma regulatory factor (Ser/Thr protein kinase)
MARHKILIADDQELMRTILVKFIERAGYDAIAAENGEEAIELYKMENPSLVISDIKMPKMNGLTLLKEIKKIDEKALVILITGFGSEDILLEALRGGAINFFKKPFKVEEIIEVVHQAVRLRDDVYYNELISPSLITEEKNFILLPLKINIVPVLNQVVMNFRLLFPDSEIINLKIGIEEMINNAVEHGCLGIGFEEKNKALQTGAYIDLVKEKKRLLETTPRKIFITSRFTETGITVIVRDEGEGFDWRVLPGLSKENLLQYNGRGIFLTKIFFDSVEYNEKGNEVTLTKKAPAGKKSPLPLPELPD